MGRPGRMLCHGCNEDLGVTRYDDESDVYVYECPECLDVDGPLTIEVSGDRPNRRRGRSGRGILAELGVYDGLLDALTDHREVWVEFGVLEHLFAEVNRDAYRELVERYGHVALAPDTNTASWLIGRAAWALHEDGLLRARWSIGRGTGRWRYLSRVSGWALPPDPPHTAVLTWEEFAAARGFDPHTHPAIDWRETPNALGAE